MPGTRDVVIVGAARTPIGRFNGALSGLPATALGGVAIRAAVERAGIEPAAVDEVVMGQVVQAGAGQAPARKALLDAGLPPTVSATTINKVCGSGMKAAMLAAQAIRAGDADVIVAGGMENMSRAPYLLPGARQGYRLGNGQVVDSVIHDGLWCACENWHMGSAADYIAREFDISREAMDDFSLESHRRAVAAQDAGKFDAEIAPVEVAGKGGPTLFKVDEGPRRDTSIEALRRLKPAFAADGLVTAGNAPGLTDGAAALTIMGGDVAERLGLKPLARITGFAQGALEPKRIFAAPTIAIHRLFRRTGMGLDDFDLIEVNEAFAAQILANGKEVGWDWNRVNVNGGAVALGHPIGASGARILVTLIYALLDRGLQRGFAAACLGGGEAVALSLEVIAPKAAPAARAEAALPA
ncbi:MAG: acetyl-CoA C-acetyltransferase [Anaerolineae bacterium]